MGNTLSSTWLGWLRDRGSRTGASAQRPSGCEEDRDTMRRYHALEKRVLSQFRLSHREHQVAQRIMEGSTYRDISRELFIAESTVRFHARNIFQKAQVNDRRAFEKHVRKRLEHHEEA